MPRHPFLPCLQRSSNIILVAGLETSINPDDDQHFYSGKTNTL